jgi:transposase-like protein
MEIDETVMRRRKYHRGRVTPSRWVFGGIERRTRRCFVKFVKNRRAATLLSLIEQHIALGTHIMSDGFASYNDVPLLFNGAFSHSVVIHADNFVNPNDDLVHTQNIESMWSRLKKKLKRMHGTRKSLLKSYLYEFEWCENFCKNQDRFSCLLTCIRHQYQL